MLGEALLDGLRAIRSDIAHNAGPSWVGPVVDVSVPGLDARQLEGALDMHGVAISRSSACRSEQDGGSEIVAAAFADEPWRARCSTRWSLGWSSARPDVDAAIAAFAAVAG